jgi:hypothetical protein
MALGRDQTYCYYWQVDEFLCACMCISVGNECSLVCMYVCMYVMYCDVMYVQYVCIQYI